MNQLLILPVIIPLATAVLCMATARWRLVQRTLGVAGAAGLLAASVMLLAQVRDGTILTHAMGAWPAPFGIIFVADAFAGAMVLVAGIVGFATAVYSIGDIGPLRSRLGFYPLLHVLLAGVCGAFLTGDLFNLFVWFEVLLIASFVLMALGGGRSQLEAATKYVVINLIASALFLSAVGITYGLVGTVNMADLAVKLADTDRPGLVTTVAMLFLVSFGIKSALFPLFFWLPSSYHVPPAAVSAIFAALLTKVGVYALIRMFTLVFTQDVGYTHTLLLWVAVLTMIAGVLGALAQKDLRRSLSYLVISAIGFMIMGLAFHTPLAVAGAVFYIVHDVIAKANLFFLSGITYRLQGTFRLDRLGGLARSHPWLAILFLVPALSLAGIPPLSGFWAKFMLVRAGLEVEAYLAIGISLAVGLLTVLAMTTIWSEAFWKARPQDTAELRLGRGRWAVLAGPAVFLAILSLVIGLVPGVLYDVAATAGEQLVSTEAYVDAVLGGAP